MGSSQSKEEIIVAQAGNSGGVTGSLVNLSTTQEALLLIIGSFIIVAIIICSYRRGKKAFERKMRREISRSLEQRQEMMCRSQEQV